MLTIVLVVSRLPVYNTLHVIIKEGQYTIIKECVVGNNLLFLLYILGILDKVLPKGYSVE